MVLLAETPNRIAGFTADLSPAQLRANPEPEEWSANDVLAHLRSCADVWGAGIMTIVAEDEPTMRAVNPRTWIKTTNYLNLEFRPSLRCFIKQRADLLAVLESLPRGSWSRNATATGAGAPLEWTVLSYADRLARRERQHLTQFEKIVGMLQM